MLEAPSTIHISVLSERWRFKDFLYPVPQRIMFPPLSFFRSYSTFLFLQTQRATSLVADLSALNVSSFSAQDCSTILFSFCCFFFGGGVGVEFLYLLWKQISFCVLHLLNWYTVQIQYLVCTPLLDYRLELCFSYLPSQGTSVCKREQRHTKCQGDKWTQLLSTNHRWIYEKLLPDVSVHYCKDNSTRANAHVSCLLFSLHVLYFK